eukprot:CAMPEP_0180122288 /NCGR_PEP_ID=MMETSP0986-20121125/3494_1 /TAXON_ID=697907 /ORGANISM="non described non described, Strain CCMP2293" /LENGTH=218 /DNA_ID=CAMNT_0022061463 /DNA_START=12 /DNA_END=667 /DNA_ORIENTATION=-
MHSLFFGVLLLAVAVHAEGDGCISVGTCMRSNKEKHTRVEAMWLWDVQLTWETFAQGGSVPLPMPHYACTKQPDLPYCPGCKSYGGFDCVLGTNCHTCQDLCEPFDMGGNTLLKEAGKCSSGAGTVAVNFAAALPPSPSGHGEVVLASRDVFPPSQRHSRPGPGSKRSNTSGGGDHCPRSSEMGVLGCLQALAQMPGENEETRLALNHQTKYYATRRT